jgi:hypothetical protein
MFNQIFPVTAAGPPRILTVFRTLGHSQIMWGM